MHFSIDKSAIFLMALFLVIILLISLFAPKIESHQAVREGVVDMMGRTVVLDGSVKKAMLFTPMPWHYLTVDETDKNIAFITKYMKDEAGQTLFKKIFPNFSKHNEALTSVGAVPLGVEQILYEKPDAVLTWEWFAKDLERLHVSGVVELKDEDELSQKRLFGLLGDLTGKEKRVIFLLKRYDDEMQQIGVKKLFILKPVTCIVLGSDDLFFWNGNWKDFNEAVKKIGGKNIAESIKHFYNGAMSVEEIIKMNPKVIFIAGYYNNPLMPLDIYKNPALQSINAVKNKRVYRMPMGMSRLDGPVESPILMEWMARLLHPDIQPNYNLRNEIRQTYQTVYGYTMSDEEIDKMLHIDENKNSAHYKIFNKENYVTTF